MDKDILSITYVYISQDKSIRLPKLRIEIDLNDGTVFAENLSLMIGNSTCRKLNFNVYSKKCF